MFHELRIGMRMLLSQPGFTLIAVSALALGIGATTLIFSVVNAVLLRPLPFPEAERVIRIGERHAPATTMLNLTCAAFLDLGGETNTIEKTAAARFFSANLTDSDQPEQVNQMLVSADYLSVLKITPSIGRIFSADDNKPGAAKVAILSDRLWRRRYAGDPSLVARTIRIGSDNVTVVGVLPPDSRPGYPFAGEYDLWTPFVPDSELRGNRRSHIIAVIARMKPGVTIEQVESELAIIARRIETNSPGIDPDMSLDAIRLHDQIVAPVRQALILFLCAVGLLLMIACANVANLMLARTSVREREMAIRAALGAGRLRLVRQLLTESSLLALIGGAAGVALATWSADIVASLNPSTFPRINEVRVDARVLIASLLVSLLTGMLFGLAPVFHLPKHSLGATLKEGGRGIAGKGRHLLRRLLVVTEVALAIALLTGAGLLINSFVRLMQVNRGFDPANVLTVGLNLPASKYPDGVRQTAVLTRMLDRVSAIPGITSAGLVSSLPFRGGAATDFAIEGRPIPDKSNEPMADIRTVDGGFFRSLRIPLRSGRTFDERDIAGAKQVMIINEEMARQHWPNEDPIGRRVTMMDWGPPLTGEIVGVVGDVRADGLDSSVRPMIYWPYPQFPTIFNNLVVRTDGDPMKVFPAIQTQVWSVDDEQPLTRIQTMEDVIAGSVAPRRFNMLLLVIFGAMALLLSAVGIYGVLSYSVAQRKHEIGIRMALGARAADVLKMIMKQGMGLTLAGVGIGLAAAFALTRLMKSLLYDVGASDPLTFSAAAVLLCVTALLACYVPARRATRLDSMKTLRHD